jgi:hypothetical protein
MKKVSIFRSSLRDIYTEAFPEKRPAAAYDDEDEDMRSDDGNRQSKRHRANQHDRKGKHKVTSVSDNG